MKVICIDDQNKPKNIPSSEWIILGETYTVIKVIQMKLQQETYGYLLEEVSLSMKSFPYEVYSAERFFPIDLVNLSIKNQQTEENVNLQDANLSLI